MQHVEDIAAQALDLPLTDRLCVAQRLWESCDLPADLLEKIDNQVALNRAKALDDGSDPGIPMNEAFASARATLECK